MVQFLPLIFFRSVETKYRQRVPLVGGLACHKTLRASAQLSGGATRDSPLECRVAPS